MTKGYSYIDHGHCWTKDNPPCGQKIEHLKCCLCELPNPKCAHKKAIREMIESKKTLLTGCNCDYNIKCNGQECWEQKEKALDDILSDPLLKEDE